jgi:PAS domain S-box-containing protein
MSNDPVRHDSVKGYIQTLQHHISVLKQTLGEWEESAAALEELQIIYEEMQTTLEATAVLEAGHMQQNQQIAAAYQYYYDLFQASPIAYLVTDADGIILDANQAIAHLLNVPQHYLIGKPLAVYIPETERQSFRTQLKQLAQSRSIQVWQTILCSREDSPFVAELHIDTVRNDTGAVENLRIGVYALNQDRDSKTRSLKEQAAEKNPASPLPPSLDGLQVLVVDDELDVREFITAILEPYGIGVRTVDNAAAALEALEQYHPDVLVSDIRMPGEDGYRLIERIRALEAKRGGHLPAAAITAYLDEDREKALSAGFEGHLHKLAQPIELVQMVAQLAGRTSRSYYDRVP